MELRLLGTLELWIDDAPAELGPQQQRCILAALAHDAGSRVSTQTLIDRIWGESPTATSRETVRKYVSRLRKILARGGGSPDILIGGHQGGYLLNIPRAAVDLHRFRQLLSDARAADSGGRHDAAARLADEALALWHGDVALPTLTGEWVDTVRNQLAQDRINANKLSAGARLRLGRHSELVGELTGLVDEHPYDETLVEYLMVALYRNGRRTAALEHYHATYRRLRDQGMEIGRRLQDVQQRILRDDPVLRLPVEPAGHRGVTPGDGDGVRPDPDPRPASQASGAAPASPRDTDHRDYSIRERRELVAALSELDVMRDRRTRDGLVAELEQELGHPVVFPRHPVDHYDISHLVDACLSHPGALWLLGSVVERSGRDSERADALVGLIRRVALVPLVEPAERRDLHDLVRDVHLTGAADLYRAVAGPAGRPLARDPADLVGILHDLEECTALPDGLPPLLVFVEYLAARVEETTGSALRRWVDRVAERLGHPAQLVGTIRSGVPDPSGRRPPRAYLVVQLQPDGVDTERYLLSIWLQYDHQVGDTVRRDDEPYSLEEIRAALDEVLTDTPMVVGGEFGELVVEFVLPRSLLNHEVDQWNIGMRLEFPRRLGIWYPVVLRSLERMRNRAMHPRWRQKWAWLQANGHASDGRPDRAVHWIQASGELDPEALLSELIIDPRPVCLVLPFPPLPTHDLGRDELAAGLHAGTPIVVWCRDRVRAHRFTGQLSALLEDGPLVELPGRALTLRQQAVATRRGDQSGDHLGLHLSILWDDPDRLPEPYVPLKAPAWRAPA